MPPVGLQVIIFSQLRRTQPDAVMSAARLAGFAAVESGPLPHESPAAFAALLKRHGLRQCATHATISNPFDPEAVAVQFALTGAADVCNSGLVRWGDVREEDYRASVAALNRNGAALRRHGIHYHYHNHDFEFREVVPGKTGMDLLAEGLDPACCGFCLDVGWVLRSAQDPVAWLRKLGPRVGYVHLKDWDGTRWVPLGQGGLPLAAILAEIGRMPSVRWVVSEQDKAVADPFGEMRASRDFLRTLGW